ncbi:hypothetical protein [Spirosoma sp. KNUC1025]|nr:hypothetical protein LN737_18020 [Spirosoma sp. KNUC1025]
MDLWRRIAGFITSRDVLTITYYSRYELNLVSRYRYTKEKAELTYQFGF